MAEKSEESGAVGYKKPPAETQFKPGQSGNRRGRSKGARSEKTILREIANEKHSIMINGELKEHRTVDLLFMRLRELAMKGDIRALDHWIIWTSKLEREAETNWTFGLVTGEGYELWEAPVPVEDVEELA